MSEPVKPSENPVPPTSPPAAAPPTNGEAAKAASTAAAAAPAKPAAAAPAKPAAPPLPPKPATPAKAGKPEASRRGFLSTVFGSWLGVAWAAFAASMAGTTFGTLRFMFPNVLSEPPAKVKVGFPESFEDGKVNERFKDRS